MCATTSKTKRSAEKNGKDCSSINEAEVTRYLEGRLSLRVASGSYDHSRPRGPSASIRDTKSFGSRADTIVRMRQV
jgi:hypothetical protein